ncbi:DedA family protein [Sinomonas terricola]|uniref:DedA family protein n=1 Tax=Sinomonas terricola TaxID=3110330 RepID=UPI003D17A2EF
MIPSALHELAAALPAVVQPKTALLPDWLNPDVFLRHSSLGPWVVLLVCGIIFAETGLLIGFFLPGDSMLFTAGLLVATGAIQFNIWLLIVCIIVAAIVGNQVGYLIGAKIGPALFSRPDSRFFKQENVRKAHEFFERHGGQALILARFVPIIRTFVPVIVGVAGMEKRKFFLYNVLGAIPWGGGVTLLGAWLGQYDWVGKNIDLIFVVIVLISVIPIIVEFTKSWLAKRRGTEPAAEALPSLEDRGERQD